MKLLSWLVCKAMNKVGEGLIIIYVKLPNDKFKHLLCEYLFIEEELQEYLNKEVYAKENISRRNAKNVDINKQPINGPTGQEKLATETEVI